MKTKLLLGMFISILTFSSCTTDSKSETTDTALTNEEVTVTQKMDNDIDDISVIADNQYEISEGSPTGKISSGGYHSLLPECATVSDLGSTTTTRVLTITFGTETTACKFRGRFLKGKIILTRTIGIAFPKIMTITFNNFFINENKIDGTTSWKREMIGDGSSLRPKTTLTMTNMTLTTNSGVYTRNGNRVREMIAGFLTRTSPTDDVFSTYGTFTTTKGDAVFTSLINVETPLINKTACGMQQNPAPFPVSGILKLSRNSHYVTIDYGNGECDKFAMKSVDGGAPVQIILAD
ncbi:hypothetical protein [Flavobacterium sp.]|uniref:hypothetical protein n=1 Tax=Flavobacterium sp. TaxID=239 RepID=UPI00286CF40D|nr:hypothetical protein [Flavobacterium sp.]